LASFDSSWLNLIVSEKLEAMGESVKAVCGLLVFFGAIALGVSVVGDFSRDTNWILCIGGGLLVVTGSGAILGLQARKDRAHDYLRDLAGTKYFNRDGFCFVVEASADDGVAYMLVHFQNQRSATCIGRVAIRPGRNFLPGRSKIEALTYEIPCEPAAYGMARIPFPLAEKYQGKIQVFEVGASVEYPDGKGERLRFCDGIFIRSNAKFGKGFSTALALAGAVSGNIVLTTPATTDVPLPTGVAEELPEGIEPEIATKWRLGDKELC
jgi:hypothetical protein